MCVFIIFSKDDKVNIYDSRGTIMIRSIEAKVRPYIPSGITAYFEWDSNYDDDEYTLVVECHYWDTYSSNAIDRFEQKIKEAIAWANRMDESTHYELNKVVLINDDYD